MTALYTDGTITLVQGSPLITGNDTGWAVALIVGGVVYVEAEGGNDLPILPDDSEGANLHPITDTQMTSAIKWTGPSGTFKYALVRDMSYSRQQSANANAIATLLQRLNAAPVAAISGILPEEDTLILFTGPDTAAVIPRSSLVQGVDYDEDADDIAGRDMFNAEPKGFSVLVADSGNGQTAIFIKRSNTVGDWSAPFYLSGPKGDKGDTGATGILDKGAYNADNAYVAGDAVLDNGSTWLAKVGVPADNPPPALPVTQNAFWRLLARRGTDGAGTGDLVGPDGAGDNRAAVFDGTDGKKLKDGGFTFGNSASRNVGTGAGTVAAGDDPRFSSGGQNDAILALAVADLQGRAVGLKGGVADAFDDETGVDVKINAVYDAANDWYVPSVGTRPVLHPVFTANATSGWTVSTSLDNAAQAYLALDGSGVSWYGAATWTPGASYFRVQAPAQQTVSAYMMRPRSDDATRMPTAFRLQGSNNGTSWTTVDTRTGITWVSNTPQTFVLSSNASYTYFQIVLDAGNTANFQMSEFAIYGTAPSDNMTLRSIAYAASAVPTTGRLAVQLVETDAITINTDLIARISRDGGVTWATAALSLTQSLNGTKMYEANGISLAALGSGTSMKWEITTANNKNVAVSGVVAQWS